MNYYHIKTDRSLDPMLTLSDKDKAAYGCHWRSVLIEGKLIEVGISRKTRDLIAVRSRHQLTNSNKLAIL